MPYKLAFVYLGKFKVLGGYKGLFRAGLGALPAVYAVAQFHYAVKFFSGGRRGLPLRRRGRGRLFGGKRDLYGL